MPWPVLVILGTAVATAYGIKKECDAYCDNKTAKKVKKDAEKLLKNAKKRLDEELIKTRSSFESLGKLKVNVFNNQIKHLVEMHKKFGSKLEGYDQNIYIGSSVEAMVQQLSKCPDIRPYIGEIYTPALNVYCETPREAQLNQMNLAAAGVCLAVHGFRAASNAEENLTNAYVSRAKVDKEIEHMESLKVIFQGIQTAAAEMTSVINEMVDRFEQVKVYDDSDKEAFYRMFLVGKGLKKILDIPILKEDGSGKENIRMECSGYLALGTCK